MKNSDFWITHRPADDRNGATETVKVRAPHFAEAVDRFHDKHPDRTVVSYEQTDPATIEQESTDV